jgi:hypothetical protein
VEGEEPYLFWGHNRVLPLPQGNHVAKFVKDPIYRTKVIVRKRPLSKIIFIGSFPHDNFSSVYWNFTKLGHMIPLWKGKNPIYFGVITIMSIPSPKKSGSFDIYP